SETSVQRPTWIRERANRPKSSRKLIRIEPIRSTPRSARDDRKRSATGGSPAGARPSGDVPAAPRPALGGAPAEIHAGIQGSGTAAQLVRNRSGAARDGLDGEERASLPAEQDGLGPHPGGGEVREIHHG